MKAQTDFQYVFRFCKQIYPFIATSLRNNNLLFFTLSCEYFVKTRKKQKYLYRNCCHLRFQHIDCNGLTPNTKSYPYMNTKLIALLFFAFICQITVQAQAVAVHISEDGVLKVCKQHGTKLHDCESRRTNVKVAVINADQTIIAIVYKDGKLEICKIKETNIEAGNYEKTNVANVEFGADNTLIITLNDGKMEYCELHERKLHNCRKK